MNAYYVSVLFQVKDSNSFNLYYNPNKQVSFYHVPHLKVRIQNNRKIEILKSQTVNNWCSKHSHPGLVNSVMSLTLPLYGNFV